MTLRVQAPQTPTLICSGASGGCGNTQSIRTDLVSMLSGFAQSFICMHFLLLWTLNMQGQHCRSLETTDSWLTSLLSFYITLLALQVHSRHTHHTLIIGKCRWHLSINVALLLTRFCLNILGWILYCKVWQYRWTKTRSGSTLCWPSQDHHTNGADIAVTKHNVQT